jgi:hypothetical protein
MVYAVADMCRTKRKFTTYNDADCSVSKKDNLIKKGEHNFLYAAPDEFDYLACRQCNILFYLLILIKPD